MEANLWRRRYGYAHERKTRQLYFQKKKVMIAERDAEQTEVHFNLSCSLLSDFNIHAVGLAQHLNPQHR